LFALSGLLLFLHAHPAGAAGPEDFAARHSGRGLEAQAAGDLEGAREAFLRVLERDEFHLPACAKLAKIAAALRDLASRLAAEAVGLAPASPFAPHARALASPSAEGGGGR